MESNYPLFNHTHRTISYSCGFFIALFFSFALFVSEGTAQTTKKKRMYEAPPVLFVATKDGNTTKFLLQDTRETECIVFDRANRKAQKYTIDDFVITVDNMPASGYISFQQDKGSEIAVYSSMEIETINYMDGNLFNKRATKFQEFVRGGGQVIGRAAIVGKSGSLKSGEEKDTENKDFKPGQSNNRRGGGRREPKLDSSEQSTQSTEVTAEADDTETPKKKRTEIRKVKKINEDGEEIEVEEEVEIEEEPLQQNSVEQAQPARIEKIVYTAKNFEAFLQKSKLAKFEREKFIATENINRSKMSSGAKSSKIKSINAKYSKDVKFLGSDKWLKTRKKTADAITAEFQIDNIYEDYVLLKKGAESWIFDDDNFLYEMKGVDMKNISASSFADQQHENHQLILTSDKLKCPMRIIREHQVQHIMYGEVDLGDFVSDKKYQLALDIEKEGSMTISSGKKYKYNIEMSQDEIMITTIKNGKQKKVEKIPVQEYCMHTEGIK